MEETSEGHNAGQNPQGHGQIGIKDTKNYYAQQQSAYQPPGYQSPLHQPQHGSRGTYYPQGIQPKFPLIPVSPYARGLALSIVMMAVGALITRALWYITDTWRSYSPFYIVGLVLFYIGAVMAFLFALGLFLLPPRQENLEKGAFNMHLGLAFVLAAIILGIALH